LSSCPLHQPGDHALTFSGTIVPHSIKEVYNCSYAPGKHQNLPKIFQPVNYFLFLKLYPTLAKMFIDKIRKRDSGILIYGITPPKIHTTTDRVAAAAERTINNLSSLDIDALVVYDVQDESARTSEERPFPFVNSIDPHEFASQHLTSLSIPKIIYRPAGKFSKDELSDWLTGLRSSGHYPVFVGLPSPDYIPKTSLSDAYSIWRDHYSADSVMGAVMIPERHALLKDEQVRILDKVNCGVSYFISQCIFNVGYAKDVLRDLEGACRENNQSIPTVIFTLTICGSMKTMQFMEWLGIYIPDNIKDALKASNNPVGCSVDIATTIAMELIQYCQERSIPFGFNIESVAIRKEEIDASLELLSTVAGLLKTNGLRKNEGRENQPVTFDLSSPLK
jgi:hypothetical protein